MYKKAFLTLLLVLMLIVPLTSCAQSNKSKEFVLGYDGVSSQWPYMAKFNRYVGQFAKDAGLSIKQVESGGDMSAQLSTVETFITQGVNTIAVLSMDRDGALPIIDMAKKAGNLPVISFLTSIRNEGEGYQNYIYVGSKNYDGGYLQGTWLSKNLPQNAGLWLLGSQAGDQQAMDRQQGMLDALKEAGRTDVKVVTNVLAENKKDKGVTFMEDWLNTYPKIDAVVGTNDDTVLGAIEAAKSAGRMKDGTIFVGLDGSDDALKSIKAGEMSMSVLQDAYNQAKALIDVVVRLKKGEDPSKIADVFIPFQAITKENVDQFINK